MLIYNDGNASVRYIGESPDGSHVMLQSLTDVNVTWIITKEDFVKKYKKVKQ
ncbi:hypothetical protein [Paenibacillus sp. SYP-B4298]|uniref:hypothetical protein n=1 Tax=Paenibacillus sp. SYP-B4298 TaxID=2996034 RepID=UPI0022DDCBB5|nr:hypothetical protein [Paenibacillus sp. SYP-B4298]